MRNNYHVLIVAIENHFIVFDLMLKDQKIEVLKIVFKQTVADYHVAINLIRVNEPKVNSSEGIYLVDKTNFST